MLSFLLFFNIAWAEVGVGSGGNIRHVSVGALPIQRISVGTNTSPVWAATSPPAITAFSVAPDSIDLDTRSTGNITFTIGVSGTAGQSTFAQVVRLPSGLNLGVTFTGANGQGISDTLPNIAQPNQTTTYRLIAQNNGGQSHRDVQVSVTQNPVLSNLVAAGRGGGPAAPQGVTIQVSGRVKGYPRPSVSIDQSIGVVSDRHFTQRLGEINTWDWSVTHFYGNQNRRVFQVTATNSSGSTTQSVTFQQ